MQSKQRKPTKAKPLILYGRVIHGQAYGKILGFPTANLDRRQYLRQKFNIKFGVYAGYATIFSKESPQSNILNLESYKAGIVIGPKDKKSLPKIEAHLLGFEGNLYNRRLVLSLRKYLRAYRNFSGVMALRRQIAKDLKAIKKLNIKQI